MAFEVPACLPVFINIAVNFDHVKCSFNSVDGSPAQNFEQLRVDHAKLSN